LGYCYISGILLFFLALLSIPYAIRVKIDNREEIFRIPDSKVRLLYEEFCEVYGDAPPLLIAYTGKPIFEEEALDVQLDVLERLEEIEILHNLSGIPKVYRDLFGSEDAQALRDDMILTPFYKGLIISKDGMVGSIVMSSEPLDNDKECEALIAAVEKAILPLKEYGFETYMVGPAALNLIMQQTTKAELARTLPPALLLCGVVLMLLFRSWRATLVALICIVITALITLGWVGLKGPSLNMVTSGFPILVLVLGLANLIHIIRRYQDIRTLVETEDQAIAGALRDTALPCAIAVFTTALGFLSLLTAKLNPIRQLGILSGRGLIVTLAVSLTLGPLLIKWLRVEGIPPKKDQSRRWTHLLSIFSLKSSYFVLTLTATLICFCLIAIGQIKVESNMLSFLPDDSKTVQAYRFVSERLTGFHSIEVILSMKKGWLHEEDWPALEKISEEMGQIQGVARVFSPLDWLKKFNQWVEGTDPKNYQLPQDGAAAQEILDLLDDISLERLQSYVRSDGKEVRVSVIVKEMDASSIKAIEEKTKMILKDLPSHWNYYLTGRVLRALDEQLGLVKTQISCFSLAFASIFLCILIGLRSPSLSMASILPNLMPILCIFGTMALMNITLNPATVMVASVSLGISVDDAVHVLNAYKLERNAGKPPHDAICTAMDKVGPAIVMTTVAACIGFFTMSSSAFIPIRYFGILSGIAMIVALLSNLFVVPAVLTLAPRVLAFWQCNRRQKENP